MKRLLFSIILVLSLALSPLGWAGSSDPVIEGKSATDILIDGGIVNNTPIGSGIPNTGAFTTLGTTGDVTVGSGGDPADAGAFRLKNADKIVWEASPAGADIEGIAVDANEIVQIGAAGASGVTITPSVTFTDIIRVTGGAFNISIGGAGGDDFTVDTNKLVVEGDTGNVGIGTTGPSGMLDIYRSDATVSGAANQNLYLQNVGGGDVVLSMLGDSGTLGFGLGIDASIDSFVISQHSNDLASNPRFVIKNTGNVGIGTIVPGNPLAVNRSADGIIVDFESADVVEGTVSIAGNTTSYNAFVGSHYTQLKQGQKELPIGAVVISTGEIIPCEANIEKETKEETEILIENAFEDVEIEENGEQIGEEFDYYEIKNEEVVEIKKPIYKKIKKMKRQLKADHALDSKTGKIINTITTKQNISPDVSGKEYFTYIDTTNQVGDKRVYGVWFGKMSDDAKGMSFGQDDKPVYLIAQVGLFKIRVTDTNGNIEIGDYLETSIRPMEARRQTESQRLNSTIAKAMVDVDWSKVNVDPTLGYKWKLIPCVF
jgi:hypothetical protein